MGTRSTVNNFTAATGTLSTDELQKINEYWCAANYLSVGRIYARLLA